MYTHEISVCRSVEIIYNYYAMFETDKYARSVYFIFHNSDCEVINLQSYIIVMFINNKQITLSLDLY